MIDESSVVACETCVDSDKLVDHVEIISTKVVCEVPMDVNIRYNQCKFPQALTDG